MIPAGTIRSKASLQISGDIADLATAHHRMPVKPRLGFLGVGRIGRNRLEAIAESGSVEIAAIADVSLEMKRQAAAITPGAAVFDSLAELLDLDLDGIVIATPSALHAEESMAALERGVAVFCQKPLARTARETHQVIDCARRANKLLGVDLSYRFVNGVPQLRDIIQSGDLGGIYAVDMVFHNAYGPDKAWFYDPKLSGGGCVIDLGTHLVDLALWALDSPGVESVSSRLFSRGKLYKPDVDHSSVEDFAVAQLELENDTTVRLTCSWKVHAGCDAVIRASFYGTRGGIELRNVGGSFHDFVVERFTGTKRQTLAAPPDSWGGRAALNWAGQLATGAGYDPSIETLIRVAETLDKIYDR